MSYHRNNMMKKKGLQKNFTVSLVTLVQKKTKQLLKSACTLGQELNRTNDTIERICVMPKIQKTKTKTTKTNSRILFILRFQCYSNLFERNRQNIHLASH